MKPSRLNKSDRQARIVAELRAAPSLRVNELALLLSVSTETVRRDLAELDERGLINRTYGGAMRPVAFEPALAEREMLMVAEREAIAATAVTLIEPNDILMIGGGATTLHFARRLAAELNHLTVITHAFSIAMALASNPLHKVLMLPGQYDGREGLIHGPDTIDALQRFRASKAILGASGVTAEGPNDAGVGPGLIYGAMMRRAARTIVLADHSKFDRPSLAVYGPWTAAMTLVSDATPEGALGEALAVAGVTVRLPA
ncbi:MAG: DeoR/GlpR transcriptional regulator [Rhizobiales bacterium]|nr:DeoR/GlpR transcriptional regulator [Hyphomicrobiales bacterium]MBI3674001.1 DeoR/GlpR transcriptional regulator [Hyphomicrobiales bacterium]